jgi:hypothetical protein
LRARMQPVAVSFEAAPKRGGVFVSGARGSRPGRPFEPRFLAPQGDGREVRHLTTTFGGFIYIGKDMEQDGARGAGDAASIEREARRDDIDWEAIKHAYLHSGWSIRRICAKHGSTYGTLRSRAKAEGWVRIVPMKSLRPGRPPRLPGTPKTKGTTKDERRRRAVTERLFKIVEAKLTEIEERMAISESDRALESAADRERDARSLAALARIYAKLVELDDAAKKARGAEEDKQESAKETGQDADRLRQDLALRLKRLDQ